MPQPVAPRAVATIKAATPSGSPHCTRKNVVVRPEGGRALNGLLRCRNAHGYHTSCLDGAVRVAIFQPANPLVKGRRYVILVDPAGAARIIDRVGKTVPFTKRPFTI